MKTGEDDMRKRKTDAERLADAGRIIADGNRENVRLRQRVRELEPGGTRDIKRALGLLKETVLIRLTPTLTERGGIRAGGLTTMTRHLQIGLAVLLLSAGAFAAQAHTTTQIGNAICVQHSGIPSHNQLAQTGMPGGSAPHCRCSHWDSAGHCDGQTCS